METLQINVHYKKRGKNETANQIAILTLHGVTEMSTNKEVEKEVQWLSKKKKTNNSDTWLESSGTWFSEERERHASMPGVIKGDFSDRNKPLP